MNDSNPTEPPPSAWRALLLHRLPDDEAQALEQRLLAEPPLLDALHEAEHDLFDDYARARLSGDERAAFQQHLLSTPEAQERLRFSHALGKSPLPPGEGWVRDSQLEDLSQIEAPSPQPAPRPSLRSPRRERGFKAPRRRRAWIAIAGGALAASLVLTVLLLPRARQPDAPQTASTGKSQTLVLLASVERGTQNAAIELALSKDAMQLRVQAEIEQPDATAHYRLSVLADDGSAAPLLRIENLALLSAGRYRYVEALLPAKLFADGAKTIRVEALPPSDSFTFDWAVHPSKDSPR